MPIVGQLDIDISCDEILQRLSPTGPAFSARPAAAMVARILEVIRRDRLITPQASFGCIDVRRGARRRIDLQDGSTLALERPIAQMSHAESILAAAWSLGPGVSHAVSEAFRRRTGLQALMLDEVASLFLFRLGERLLERLRQRFAARGLCIGAPLAPGDGALALTAQGLVLKLADARQIGIGLGQSGVMSPLKTATAVAAVGRRIRAPQRDWSCTGCASIAACRLRTDQVTRTGHDHALCS